MSNSVFLRILSGKTFTIEKGKVIEVKKKGHKPLINDGIAEYVEIIKQEEKQDDPLGKIMEESGADRETAGKLQKSREEQKMVEKRWEEQEKKQIEKDSGEENKTITTDGKQEKIIGFVAQLVTNKEIFEELSDVIKKYKLILYNGSVKSHKIYHVTLQKPDEIGNLDLEKAKSHQIATGNIADVTVFSNKIIYLLDNKKHVTVAEGDGVQKCLNENKDVFKQLLNKQLIFSPPEIIKKSVLIFFVDEDQIKKHYKAITRGGMGHKYQGFKKDGSTTGFIDVKNVEHFIELCKENSNDTLSCLSLNSTKLGEMRITGVKEIKNIVADFDVEKKRLVNGVSTEEDKAVVLETMEKATKKLEETHNLRVSMSIGTGNGGHIVCPVNIPIPKDLFIDKLDKAHIEACPNCSQSMQLKTGKFVCAKCGKEQKIEQILERINIARWERSDIRGKLVAIENLLKEFNNEVISVDCLTKDIARRTKAAGTYNIKPDILPENYRMAYIKYYNEEVLSNFYIEANTKVFNSLEPAKKEVITPVTSATPKIQDFERLLKKDKKLKDLYNGDWNREPYNLKDDGTPRERWSRSEAEHAILTKLIWYEYPKSQIFQIMNGCKIGKWQERSDNSKEQVYASAVKWVNEHGGTKSAAQVIPILNDDRQIGSLRICGLKSYEILDGDEVIDWGTSSKDTIWYESSHYRRLIKEALSEHFGLKENKAKAIATDVCKNVRNKFKQLKEKHASTSLTDEELEDIIDNTVVEVTPSRASNEYRFRLKDGEIIELTDRDIINGPQKFMLEFFNLYHRFIKISKDTWEENLIPELMKKLIIVEERLERPIDIICTEFLQRIGSSSVYDWKDTKMREMGYDKSVFLDVEKDYLYVCSEFVNLFFKEQRFEQQYKITPLKLNTELRQPHRRFLAKKSESHRVRGFPIPKAWWVLKAKKVGKTEQDIIREGEETKQSELKELEKEKTDVSTGKDFDIHQYKDTVQHIEEIIGNEHLVITDIAKRMHITVKNEIDVLQKIIDTAIDDSNFETLLQRDDNICYYVVHNEKYKTEKEKQGKKSVTEIEKPTSDIKEIVTKYTRIKSIPELKATIEDLRSKSVVAVDVETDSSTDNLNDAKVGFLADLVGIGLAGEPGESYYVPFKHRNEGQISLGQEIKDRNIPWEEACKLLSELLVDENVQKVCHNSKFELQVLHRAGLDIKSNPLDTLIASQMINTQKGYGHTLDRLVLHYFNHKMQPLSNLIKPESGQQIPFSAVNVDKAAQYCGEDADYCLRLWHKLEVLIKELELSDVYYKIEIPLIPIVTRMEEEGINIDVGHLDNIAKSLEEEINNLEKAIFKEAGKEFSLSKNREVSQILFTELGLTVMERTPKQDEPSVAMWALEKISNEHPIVNLILEHRHLQKLRRDFVIKLPSMLNPHTKRLHPTFNQLGTVTGRMSSKKPNAQQIPQKGKGIMVRKAFIPGNENYQILVSDYKQMEMRILAHFSKDPTLIEDLKKKDIHTQTAMTIYNVNENEVAKHRYLRDNAKTFIFALNYCASAQGLAQSINCSTEEAQKFIDNYFARYPRVKKYRSDTINFLHKNNFVSTLLGRKRFFPELYSTDFYMQRAYEREAVNSRIQGSGSDVIKMAMININKKIKDLKSSLLLQIHDELILNVHRDEIEKVKEIVKFEMEHAIELCIPLIVDIGIGNNWLDAKEKKNK